MKRRSEKVFLVEGKYDKIRLESVLDAVILTTDGFGIFKNEEKRALLRTIAEKKGLVVLTDADGAGKVIRGHIRTITGGKGVTDLYIPALPGKEKRKEKASREGMLGVEGMNNRLLEEILEKGGVLCDAPGDSDSAPTSANAKAPFTKADLYRLGFSGRAGAEEKRRAFLQSQGLPPNLSANALLEAVNLLGIELNEK